MRRIKLFFLIIGTLLSTTLALAQGISVSGVIKDATSGEPVPFASVMVKGTMNGVSADGNGKYTITVPANGVLIFSAVGYQSAEVPTHSKSKVDVILEVDTESLENAVVVGYGTKKNVSSLVGSVKVVSSETIKNAPSSSALDNLQGQVAGLAVLTSSGVAGDNAVSMTLHGVGSLGASSTPLYIIDGIPSTSRAIMAMNPNDIESISVLKDASATSIYGSRAANGVIYVTTKAGNFNEKATVTARFQYGTSTLASTRLYDNMMDSDELTDFWIKSGLHTADWIQETYYDNGYHANTKWWKYFMNLWTPQYQSDLTISGGSAKVAYMISASQFHQDGFTLGNFYDRYTVRSNVQAHPTNWLKAGVNVNLSLDQNQSNGNWGDSSGNSNYLYGGLAYLWNPLYSPDDRDADGEGDPSINLVTLGVPNPYYYFKNYTNEYTRITLNGNAFLEINPIRNLTIASRLGVDAYGEPRTLTMPYSVAQNIGSTATEGKSNEYAYQATITNTIEYLWDLNYNNKFTFLVGQEGIKYYYHYNYAQSYGQTDDRMMLLQQGTQDTYDLGESYSEYAFLSFFAHVDYTLRNKYYFDAVVRNDASSRFGKSNRNAQFWSLGARWNLKREPWLLNNKTVTALDLKLSYGTQGNAEIGNYASLGIISSSGTYEDATGRNLTQPANDKLTWEKQGLATVTASGRLWNRFDFEFEFYDRRTRSMLMDVPNPYTTGFDDVSDNVGTLKNQGIDITLGVDILSGKDYFLRFSTTFSYNSQVITELFDGRDRWEIANTGLAYVVGKAVSYYYPIYAGIDPADGQPMWYLPGDDVDVTTMDPTRTTKTFDEDVLTQNTGKKRYAPVNGGFTLSGSWKGISLQADFSYCLGKWMINNDAYFYANPSQNPTYNTMKDVADFWTPSHTDAKWPDWGSGAVMQFDTHLLENASFLRLKNLQVGYSFPQKLLNWSNGVLKGVKFTFTGRNLFTCTKYTGLDPETDRNVSLGVAGNSRQILGGIELTF
ncbi:MAG: SusC/RagA family TonB-linked outer membrane protein [Bacteroidales bacterium]|nr:SusC/RagA family TonB-linked outer membrane protein [Bacteroidales bacterium]